LLARLVLAAIVAVAAGALGAGAVTAAAPGAPGASAAAAGTGATVAPVPAASAAAPAVPQISGHFALQTLDGRPVTDDTYRGKWLLVYFGYTSCPDICPTVLLRVGQALDSLGSLSDRVQPIFITVDPARDTTERLSKYMAAFNSRIVGLRGSPEQIREAARQFHVYYNMRNLGNGTYTVDHSSFLYVVTPEGRFEKLLADSLPADQLAGELRTLVSHFADADDVAKVTAGKALYARWCAGCHGRKLQGQPLWQLQDQYAGRRAPAHDQTGHTWTHSDDDLFLMTRDGRFPSTDPSAPSYMPAFHELLTDEQTIAVIAYIKASWPVGLRISQAQLNPGNAGMPTLSATDVDWTLPPTCSISTQRWRTSSR
jgi:protein SCO1/2